MTPSVLCPRSVRALGGFLELGNDGCALAGFAVLTIVAVSALMTAMRGCSDQWRPERRHAGWIVRPGQKRALSIGHREPSSQRRSRPALRVASRQGCSLGPQGGCSPEIPALVEVIGSSPIAAGSELRPKLAGEFSTAWTRTAHSGAGEDVRDFL